MAPRPAAGEPSCVRTGASTGAIARPAARLQRTVYAGVGHVHVARVPQTDSRAPFLPEMCGPRSPHVSGCRDGTSHPSRRSGLQLVRILLYCNANAWQINLPPATAFPTRQAARGPSAAPVRAVQRDHRQGRTKLGEVHGFGNHNVPNKDARHTVSWPLPPARGRSPHQQCPRHARGGEDRARTQASSRSCGEGMRHPIM